MTLAEPVERFKHRCEGMQASDDDTDARGTDFAGLLPVPAVFVRPVANGSEVRSKSLQQSQIACRDFERALGRQLAIKPHEVAKRIILRVAPCPRQFLEPLAVKPDMDPVHRFARIDGAGDDVVKAKMVLPEKGRQGSDDTD